MHAYISHHNTWLNAHLRHFIKEHVPGTTFHDSINSIPANADAVYDFSDGKALKRGCALMLTAGKILIGAYPNNSALSRKDYLSYVIDQWATKRPNTVLKDHTPLTFRLQLDYAEYVEDSLSALEDLSLLSWLEEDARRKPETRRWWILKPALVECAVMIRLFSTIDELAGHLEMIDDESDEDTSGDIDKSDVGEKLKTDHSSHNLCNAELSFSEIDHNTRIAQPTALKICGTASPPLVTSLRSRIPSSQIREFVAQEYIGSINPVEGRKWHVRAYILSIGRLKVYVYREMLALLASLVYEDPWKNPSLLSSLSNTSLQEQQALVDMESSRDFWALPEDLFPYQIEGSSWKDQAFEQICNISSDLFRAAIHTMPDKFIALDSFFGLFGADFMLDANGKVWLLEINEGPGLYEEGHAGSLSKRLMESTVVLTLDYMGLARNCEKTEEASKRMVPVLDETGVLPKSRIVEITVGEGF